MKGKPLSQEAKDRAKRRPPEYPFLHPGWGSDLGNKVVSEIIKRLDQLASDIDTYLLPDAGVKPGPGVVHHQSTELLLRCKIVTKLFKQHLESQQETDNE